MNRTDLALAVGAFTAGVAVGYLLLDDQSCQQEQKAECAGCAAKDQISEASVEACAVGRDEIADALFFPDPGYACEEFVFNPDGCKFENCQYLHEMTGLAKMCRRLQEAKSSIDVCIYTLSNHQLVAALLNALERNVQVRVIIDCTMAKSAANQLNKIGTKGALVYEANSAFLMHHKFTVIDKRVAMTGSFNWTEMGSQKNYDNVLIFSDARLVQKYAAKFEELWHDFADMRVPSHPLDSVDERQKWSAWGNIIVGYEPPVNNYNSSRTRMAD